MNLVIVERELLILCFPPKILTFFLFKALAWVQVGL